MYAEVQRRGRRHSPTHQQATSSPHPHPAAATTNTDVNVHDDDDDDDCVGPELPPKHDTTQLIDAQQPV